MTPSTIVQAVEVAAIVVLGYLAWLGANKDRKLGARLAGLEEERRVDETAPVFRLDRLGHGDEAGSHHVRLTLTAGREPVSALVLEIDGPGPGRPIGTIQQIGPDGLMGVASDGLEIPGGLRLGSSADLLAREAASEAGELVLRIESQSGSRIWPTRTASCEIPGPARRARVVTRPR